MKKVLIWGAGSEYQATFNQIQFEVIKKNIEILGIVSKDAWQEKIDGIPALKPSEIKKKNIEIDYIIVTSQKYYYEIVNEAVTLGIERNRLINIKVFRIPYFDFGEYISLRENPVSIITSNCMGGFLYHYLDLCFSSPFINTFIYYNDFEKLTQNLYFYLNQPLKEECAGDMLTCPVGSLGEEDKKIYIQFRHDYNFDMAREAFDKRRRRINWDNLLITTYSNKQEEIERFEKIPYQKKICISGLRNMDGLYPATKIFKSWEACYMNNPYDVYRLREFADYYNNIENFVNECNIFKLLLNGEFIQRYTVQNAILSIGENR